MVYVYCSRLSEGAKLLVETLGGVRLRNFDGQDFWRRGRRVRLTEFDVVVCWGSHLPELEDVRILNWFEPTTKLDEWRKLISAGVNTIQLSEPEFIHPTTTEWLPRLNYHQGGNDLLNPPRRPDFYTKREHFTREYRIHSFSGRSIRAGLKVPRDGFALREDVPEGQVMLTAHPWIKSWDAGWKISYDPLKTQAAPIRRIAHKAVKALDLTFGAVDVGERQGDSELLVLEVNKGPGIEGGSILKYATAIKLWIQSGNDGAKVLEEED